MKQILSILGAGIFGGIVALSGSQFLQNSSENKLTPEFHAKAANYINTNPRQSVALVDFRMAAQKTIPSVVHIMAQESDKVAQADTDKKQPSQEDIFGRLFGDQNPLGDLFGKQMPREGSGSGVIYSSDGYIITNNHVVDGADELTVTLSDKRKFKAKVIGKDPKTDLAVIKIEANNLPTLQIANSDEVEVGEWALAVGNPYDLSSTVTAGIVSAKGRNIGIIKENYKIESFIQTDAAVNPGNSGGALVNANGDLIGINTAILSKMGSFAGYSFAIPTNLMKKVVEDLIQFGSFKRGVMGVEIADVDEQDKKTLKLSDNVKGVVVVNVLDSGAAQYAGVLPNDVILAVDGKSVKTSAELINDLSERKVGDTVKLLIFRNGKEQTIPVKLKAG